MKKTFRTLTAITGIMTMLAASCSRNDIQNTGIGNGCLLIDMNLQQETADTKSSSTADFTLSTNCTVAFYSQSDGHLVTSGSCSGGARQIIIYDVPTEVCNVYAAGNVSFEWPADESAVKDISIPVDVMSGCPPHATQTGEYTYSPGIHRMDITCPALYAKLTILKTTPEGDTFEAVSARAFDCPNSIKPFEDSGKAYGTEGAQDTASVSDITLFNSDESFVMYVPCYGNTKIELNGIRRNHTDGFNYDDTYQINVPSQERKAEGNVTFVIDGTNHDDQIVVVIGYDTRTLLFGKTEMTVPCVGKNYSTYVKGTAGNGDNGWSYTLSWNGVAELEGNTTFLLDNNSMNIGEDGTATFTGTDIDREIAMTFNSTYSGSEPKTVTFTASINGTARATMNVTFCKPSIEYIQIIPEYNQFRGIIGTGWPVTITAHYDDGSDVELTPYDNVQFTSSNDNGGISIGGSPQRYEFIAAKSYVINASSVEVTAEYEGKSDTRTFECFPELVELTISTFDSYYPINEPFIFSAELKYRDNAAEGYKVDDVTAFVNIPDDMLDSYDITGPDMLTCYVAGWQPIKLEFRTYNSNYTFYKSITGTKYLTIVE